MVELDGCCKALLLVKRTSAFVREQVEQGNDLPHDLFNVFIGEKATITRKG